MTIIDPYNNAAQPKSCESLMLPSLPSATSALTLLLVEQLGVLELLETTAVSIFDAGILSNDHGNSVF